MNIGINTSAKTATTIDGKNKTVTNLSKVEVKEAMSELCESDDMLEALRFCSKKFKSTKFLFKDVKE